MNFPFLWLISSFFINPGSWSHLKNLLIFWTLNPASQMFWQFTLHFDFCIIISLECIPSFLFKWVLHDLGFYYFPYNIKFILIFHWPLFYSPISFLSLISFSQIFLILFCLITLLQKGYNLMWKEHHFPKFLKDRKNK